MKTTLLLFVLFPFTISAQSPAVASPSAAATVPSPACLGCQGEIWSNETNVFAADNQAADITLMQYGNCFQSTCYLSRFLYASSFGFSIPAGATIDSVLVDITRAGYSPNAIRDTIIELTDGLSVLGANQYSTAIWAANTTVTYGHSNPLWSYTFTPAIINGTGFGVELKAMNISGNTSYAGVDHMQITVYYSTTTGIYSQTSSPATVTWINQSNTWKAHLDLPQSGPCTGYIYDVNGRLIGSEDYGILPAGESEVTLHELYPAQEILLWEIIPGDHQFTEVLFYQPQ